MRPGSMIVPGRNRWENSATLSTAGGRRGVLQLLIFLNIISLTVTDLIATNQQDVFKFPSDAQRSRTLNNPRGDAG